MLNIIANSLPGVMISASDTNEVNYNTRICLFLYFYTQIVLLLAVEF